MNQLYTSARNNFLLGNTNWETHLFGIILVDDFYVFDVNHSTYADITEFGRVSDIVTVGGRTALNGFATGGSVTFAELTHTAPITQAILMKIVTVEEQSELIAYYDTVDGLPITPTGDDYNMFSDLLFGGYFRL